MNTQNVEFLKNSLLNLGFGEKLNQELEQNMEKKVPEFTLAVQNDYNGQKVDYNLHFKKGDNADMYFFNKYDVTLDKGKGEELKQSFYINKGHGVTAKEAFNLMEGRAVHKQLYNKENEKYPAWVQLDKENLTEGGNQRMKTFNENYGYEPEKVLAGLGIKEMDGGKGQEDLMRSLKKGNSQQITVERDGQKEKYFISANPQFKTVDVADQNGKRIKREELLQPGKAKGQGQYQNKGQKKELPEHKPVKKRKLKV